MYDGKPNIPENLSGAIRFGGCMEHCPEQCNNNGDWKYLNGTRDDYDVDPKIGLTWQDGE